jgi:uncharacterized protein YndB with AHSA1/START domain
MNATAFELRGDREIVMTRAFSAPARIVFDAWTKPELVRRWWAPQSHGVAMAECTADVREGGRYRYVLRGDRVGEIAFSGTYTLVQPYTQLAYSQIFEPMAAAGAAQVTVTFEERDGKTYLTVLSQYPSKQTRDAAVASGMEHGARETMDQLDELLA